MFIWWSFNLVNGLCWENFLFLFNFQLGRFQVFRIYPYDSIDFLVSVVISPFPSQVLLIWTFSHCLLANLFKCLSIFVIFLKESNICFIDSFYCVFVWLFPFYLLQTRVCIFISIYPFWVLFSFSFCSRLFYVWWYVTSTSFFHILYGDTVCYEFPTLNFLFISYKERYVVFLLSFNFIKF